MKEGTVRALELAARRNKTVDDFVMMFLGEIKEPEKSPEISSTAHAAVLSFLRASKRGETRYGNHYHLIGTKGIILVENKTILNLLRERSGYEKTTINLLLRDLRVIPCCTGTDFQYRKSSDGKRVRATGFTLDGLYKKYKDDFLEAIPDAIGYLKQSEYLKKIRMRLSEKY